MIVDTKRYSNDPVQRVFGDTDQIRTVKLGSQHLSNHTESDRLLFEVLRPATNQVKTRIRRIDADEQKLSTQPKIDRKRHRRQLIDLADISSGKGCAKLINNTL